MEKNKKYNIAYIEQQIHNLSKLVEINKIINSTLDIGKLLLLVMEMIKDIMETEASTLLLYEDDTNDLVFKVALGKAGKDLVEKYRVKIGQGIAGCVAQDRKALYINNVYEDKRFDPSFDKNTGFTTKSILCVPLLFKGKLLGVIQAINPINRPGFDDDDQSLFNAFANQTALAVQNAIFFQKALEEERIRNEISSAQSIQKSLLPEINCNYNNIKISAKSISAREVGGEFYDIFHFDNKSFGVVLGNIHTKGIPGALYASIVSGAVKALSNVSGGHPSLLLKILNNVVIDNLETIINVSLFYGLISCTNTSIKFVNAGIAYPILIRKGIARYLKFSTKSLGKEILKIKKISVTLRPGDFFVIISDGITNLKNKGAQTLGLKRIMDFLGNDFKTPEEIVNSLILMADDYTEGLEKMEDISIIALKIE